MEDGTPIRVEGVGKESQKGHKMMSFKVATIPGDIYENQMFEANIPSYKANSGFLEG